MRTLLVVLVAIGLVACGGGSTGGAGGGAGSTGGGAGSTGGGAGGSGGGACPALPSKTGTLDASYRKFDNSTVTFTAVPEVGCRTLRGRDGSVKGYLAVFARFTPSTSASVDAVHVRTERVQVLYRGSYAGDGTYTNVSFTVQQANGDKLESSTATLVLTNGGRSGALTGPDQLTMAFTCDAADDVAATAGAPLMDQAGRLIIENSGLNGAAFAFDDLSCTGGPTKVTLSSPGSQRGCSPTGALLVLTSSTMVSGPGTYPLDPGSYAYADFANACRVSNGGGQNMVLTEVSPPAGTLQASGPGCAGSFRCR